MSHSINNLHYPFDWDALAQQELSPCNQSKVIEITHIASILKQYGAPPLTADDFDILYDKHAVELMHITHSNMRMLRERMYQHEGE